MQGHKFSFIIASVDRDEKLQQCIGSIEKAHKYKPDTSIEILVVIQKAAQKKNIHVRYPEITAFYYMDKAGLSVARNFAITKSSGHYCIFLDDDAIVKEDILFKIEEGISEYNDVGAFSGRLVDLYSNMPFSSCYALTAEKSISRYKYYFFRGSAIILKRSLQEKIGLFDERFGSGAKFYGAEDTDIFFRIKQAGERVIYLPGVVFYHDIALAPPPSKVFNYYYAAGAVFTKQILNDPIHSYVYLWIVLNMLARNLLRLIQGKLFPSSLRQKNIRFQYGAAFRGMLSGILGFFNIETKR